MFPSWAMVRKLSKKVHFLQFCADSSKKSKSTKAINIYASEKVLLRTFRKWYCLLGITKPCTHLHSAPSTSSQLHPPPPGSFQAPPSSFQPPPSSLKHPQQYLDQKFLGQKLKVVHHFDWKLAHMVYWRCWFQIQT